VKVSVKKIEHTHAQCFCVGECARACARDFGTGTGHRPYVCRWGLSLSLSLSLSVQTRARCAGECVSVCVHTGARRRNPYHDIFNSVSGNP
jgi:hypothetical protein